MQGADGGWAAFDVDNNWEFLSPVPFADHNAMLDPTCPDITGRVLEALAALGVPNTHPAVQRGVEYLKRTRKPTEAGTAAGASTTSTAPSWRCEDCAPRERATAKPYILRAANGCAPFRTPTEAGAKAAPATTTGFHANAHSTPSQTAWAILGLLAGGTAAGVRNGIEYLIETQAPTEAGTRIWPPAPGSRACSTCSTTCIEIRFRCWLWPSTGRPKGARTREPSDQRDDVERASACNGGFSLRFGTGAKAPVAG